jgi:probable selenium-dependent hydroxylase accessory protein YqeC
MINKNQKFLLSALCKETKGIISLIGAGGKTTLMFRLARELAASGNKVLTTTTTKIMMPDKNLSPVTLLSASPQHASPLSASPSKASPLNASPLNASIDDLIQKSKAALEKYPHFSAGRLHNSQTGKIEGLTPDTIDELAQTGLFDYIIVEADGSRQKALKATDSHEPVLPESSSMLILLAGLDAVGRPLDAEHIHRPEIFSENTGLDLGKAVDEASVSAALEIELKKVCGLCKAREYVVFLNRADSSGRIESGMLIGKMLIDRSLADKIIIASLHDEACIRKIVVKPQILN